MYLTTLDFSLLANCMYICNAHLEYSLKVLKNYTKYEIE